MPRTLLTIFLTFGIRSQRYSPGDAARFATAVLTSAMACLDKQMIGLVLPNYCSNVRVGENHRRFSLSKEC
jgi:hypothetical protein